MEVIEERGNVSCEVARCVVAVLAVYSVQQAKQEVAHKVQASHGSGCRLDSYTSVENKDKYTPSSLNVFLVLPSEGILIIFKPMVFTILFEI